MVRTTTSTTPQREGINRTAVLKVVILGDGGVGKSCLMNRFVNDQFDPQSMHTVGVEFLKKTITVDNQQYTLQIWDTAGQERFRSLRTPFYRGSDICILVYAIDDRRSLENLTMWKDEFSKYSDTSSNLDRFPFVVVGNKADLRSDQREIETSEGELWCREHGSHAHVEASAKDSTNVELAFQLAVKVLHGQVNGFSSGESERMLNGQRSILDSATDVVDLKKIAKQNRKSKCC